MPDSEALMDGDSQTTQEDEGMLDTPWDIDWSYNQSGPNTASSPGQWLEYPFSRSSFDSQEYYPACPLTVQGATYSSWNNFADWSSVQAPYTPNLACFPLAPPLEVAYSVPDLYSGHASDGAFNQLHLSGEFPLNPVILPADTGWNHNVPLEPNSNTNNFPSLPHMPSGYAATTCIPSSLNWYANNRQGWAAITGPNHSNPVQQNDHAKTKTITESVVSTPTLFDPHTTARGATSSDRSKCLTQSRAPTNRKKKKTRPRGSLCDKVCVINISYLKFIKSNPMKQLGVTKLTNLLHLTKPSNTPDGTFTCGFSTERVRTWAYHTKTVSSKESTLQWSAKLEVKFDTTNNPGNTELCQLSNSELFVGRPRWQSKKLFDSIQANGTLYGLRRWWPGKQRSFEASERYTTFGKSSPNGDKVPNIELTVTLYLTIDHPWNRSATQEGSAEIIA